MYTLANMVTSIKNGYLARNQFVTVPYSRLKEAVAKKLVAAGFIEAVTSSEERRYLQIKLLYKEEEPAIRDIKIVSKPSLRIYTSARKIPRVLGGRGEVIVSTPKGILTGAEARRAKAGGETILKVW